MPIGLATLFGALSLRANAADTPAQASALAPGFIHISCRPVAEHSGMTPGRLVSKVPPRYPEEARKAGIEGTAVLSATITKSGTLEELKALLGPKGSSTSDPASGRPVAVRALSSERQTHRGQAGNHGRLQPRVKCLIAQTVDE
jgi:TonB family protein